MSDNTWSMAFKFHTLGRCVIPSGGGPEGKSALIAWKRYQTERPDDAQLENWERELSPKVWAMPTGAVSGCFVLDDDTKEATNRTSPVVASTYLFVEAKVYTTNG